MSDHFEQLLRRQPLRKIPQEWRAEILAAAPSNNLQRVASEPAASFLSFLSSHMPLVRWGALAAVWMVILSLNHAARDTRPEPQASYTPPSPQMLLVLREQNKLLAELIEPASGNSAADRPKTISPRPRSERQLEIFTV